MRGQPGFVLITAADDAKKQMQLLWGGLYCSVGRTILVHVTGCDAPAQLTGITDQNNRPEQQTSATGQKGKQRDSAKGTGQRMKDSQTAKQTDSAKGTVYKEKDSTQGKGQHQQTGTTDQNNRPEQLTSAEGQTNRTEDKMRQPPPPALTTGVTTGVTTGITIGLLQTGQNRADLNGSFDDYPVLFDRLLNRRADPRWCEMQIFRVLDGVFPQQINACDGYIVTGSAAGVYDDHSWMAPLMDFIRAAHEADIPMLGICFGHQAIAQALGGEVVKWPHGWGVGVRPTRFVRCPVAGADNTTYPQMPDDAVLQLIYFHQDQVTCLPDGAERLASSDFCEQAGFTISNASGVDTVLCLQGHPEFDADYSAALLDAIAGKVGEERTIAAKASLRQPADSGVDSGVDFAADSVLVASWIRAFFTTALQQSGQAA